MDLPFEVEDDDTPPSGTKTGAEDALASSVLIVDDEVAVLDVFTHLLSREPDLSVATAETAAAALELIRARRFDVMITDKNLPGMGGIELIIEARKLRPAMEAIMITGFASAESVLAALAAGASDYLRKPFDDLKVVRAKIRAALGRRAERVKNRDESRRIAREASALLEQGKLVPDPIWETLERELALYDQANREPGRGVVRVVGSIDLAVTLRDPSFDSELAFPDEAALEKADVVVLSMDEPGWRAVAERLAPSPADVVLLARGDADVGDLLDALQLHMDLVGFGSTRPDMESAVATHVKALLMRRTIERTQESLGKALEAFRQALKNA